MRGFQEIRGQCTRIIYDRERANFVIKTEPHRFAVRKPDSEVDPSTLTAMARSR